MGCTSFSNFQRRTGRNGLTTSAEKKLLDLGTRQWNGINQKHGWVASVQHAIEHMVPTVNDFGEHWNLVVAYELYTATLLKVPNLVFMPGKLVKHKLVI